MMFQRGDALQRPGPAGTMHRGIFAGYFNGRPWVIHNAKGNCVRFDLLEVFAEGQPVSLFKRVARTVQEQNVVVSRAHSLLGRKFDVLNFNCDHLVTYALAGVATSPQLAGVIGMLALASLVGFVVASGRT